MVQFFVLINGCSVDFFGNSRGLRQGDLLSPMLFFIMIEVFNKMLKRVDNVGLFRGFNADSRGWWGMCHISCLQMILFYFVM